MASAARVLPEAVGGVHTCALREAGVVLARMLELVRGPEMIGVGRGEMVAFDGVYQVASGMVQIQSGAIGLGVLGAGEVFGLRMGGRCAWVVSGAAQLLYWGLDPNSVARAEVDRVKAAGYDWMSERLQLMQLDASTRVARWLAEFAGRFGVEQDCGWLSCEMVSHDVIAAEVQSDRPTVTRALRELRKADIVRYSRVSLDVWMDRLIDIGVVHQGGV